MGRTDPVDTAIVRPHGDIIYRLLILHTADFLPSFLHREAEALSVYIVFMRSRQDAGSYPRLPHETWARTGSLNHMGVVVLIYDKALMLSSHRHIVMRVRMA